MISIIIPVYNTQDFLPRCIDSVLNQQYQDWELILVDDCSTDQSGKICDAYAANDSRIQVLHQENQGPAAARQNGLEQANGEWILFADSDDWLDTKILSTLWEHQQQTGAGIVCCTLANVNEQGKMNIFCPFEESFIDCYTPEDCILHMHQTRLLTGGPWCKLFHKTLFDGINFCTNVTIGEDYSMIVQLVQKAGRVRLLSDALYYRFVRKGSISHTGYSERHQAAFDNYMRIRLELIAKYPNLEKDIIGFHTEYEMAVITAMCRNKNFDHPVIDKLKKDLHTYMQYTWSNPQIPFYMKCCAWLIAYPTPLFIFLFRILHLLTGR